MAHPILSLNQITEFKSTRDLGDDSAIPLHHLAIGINAQRMQLLFYTIGDSRDFLQIVLPMRRHIEDFAEFLRERPACVVIFSPS